jgi:hypothetical protein
MPGKACVRFRAGESANEINKRRPSRLTGSYLPAIMHTLFEIAGYRFSYLPVTPTPGTGCTTTPFQ